MELKGKRELFCREYIARNFNGTQAALAAGYSKTSARTEASQMLALPEVQDRIAELGAARNQKLEVDAELIILELLRMLTTDIALAFNADGTLKDVDDIPLDLRRAIQSIEVEEKFEREIPQGEAAALDNDKLITTRVKKVKFWSKEKAAELLGRHLVLFKDVLKVDGLDDIVAKIHAARSRTDAPAA